MLAEHSLPLGSDDVLAAFYAGDRAAMAAVYEEYFDIVYAAVGRVLADPDRETVVHELFLRLFASEELRRHFAGGSLAAWLTTLARNQAIDHQRRRRRDVPLDSAPPQSTPETALDDQLHARRLIDSFRRDVLPAKWDGVFVARFLEGLTQREAAERLGLSRTTLVYRELRIESLLRRFLLKRHA